MQDDYSSKSIRKDAPPHDSRPDLTGYTAFDTYAPVYTGAKHYLYERYKTAHARAIHLVLEAIAERCSNLGVTMQWSENKLIKRSHQRRENVQLGISTLIALGWIREHRTYVATKRREIVDWQLSPYVLHIGPPDIFDAFELWRNSKPVDTARIFAYQNQSPESESKHRFQTHIPDKDSRPARKGASSGSVDNWDEVSIEQCREALPSSTDETTAQNVAALCKMRVSQGRRLVLSYSASRVNTALVMLNEYQQKETVHNPGGVIVAWLRKEYGRKAPPAENVGAD